MVYRVLKEFTQGIHTCMHKEKPHLTYSQELENQNFYNNTTLYSWRGTRSKWK